MASLLHPAEYLICGPDFILKRLVSVSLFWVFFSFIADGQLINGLNLIDPGSKIENTICIYTTRLGVEAIRATSGQKVTVKASLLVINGDTIVPERITTRGQTTLMYRRKSFSFSLGSKASFRHGGEKESFRKFFALSLSMDRNYANNRMAFEMMKGIKLFNLFYSFCELRINDGSEGIYMILERPEDFAMERKNSPLMLRRGYEEKIEKKEVSDKAGREEIRSYSDNYRQIYNSLNKYHGEELYKVLSGLMDMDSYMTWLAFNFFVRNSDYTDEVYMYIDPETRKFKIIPWDYDDIFSVAPHEGLAESRKLQGDKLIFSAEDLLDQKIGNDGYLYRIYLNKFREMLEQLSPSDLKEIFENTFSELCPYYSKNEIISMSKYDRYPGANIGKLRDNLAIMYDQLVLSRNLYLNLIEEILKAGQ